jgi:hypothetical protein
MGIECSVHAPSQFLQTNREYLLPAWHLPVRSVLVVLQECAVPLVEDNPTTDIEKQKLRQQFIDFGRSIAHELDQLGCITEIFDPPTGSPLFSEAGQIKLDDIAVIHAVLGYQPIQQGACRMIAHPIWGCAVYPSVLVSTAEPEVLSQVLNAAIAQVDNPLPTRDARALSPQRANIKNLPESGWRFVLDLAFWSTTTLVQ